MSKHGKEYTLAQLVEEPAVELDLEEEGIDRRSLELLLELTDRRPQPPHRLPSAPFVG